MAQFSGGIPVWSVLGLSNVGHGFMLFVCDVVVQIRELVVRELTQIWYCSVMAKLRLVHRRTHFCILFSENIFTLLHVKF
jgi:hypothetical protein